MRLKMRKRSVEAAMKRRSRATAYHEAGHAVVAVALRIPVQVASTEVDFEDCSAGRCLLGARWTESLDYADGSRKHADYATESMAGVMALTLWRYRRAATFDELQRERHDWGNVVAAASSVVGPGGDATAFCSRARLRAERILRARWPAVQRIADALHERRTLSGRTVRLLARS